MRARTASDHVHVRGGQTRSGRDVSTRLTGATGDVAPLHISAGGIINTSGHDPTVGNVSNSTNLQVNGCEQ